MNESAADATPSPSIAIVGSGPSGCYIAQFLRKRWSDSEIVIFDRHDAPYGLVRYGVAPDHLGTKAISRQFDRLFERDRVIFVGRTEVGTDVTLDELRAAFDVVVLATGLWADKEMGIPGSGLSGVLGSGKVTRLINGHPDESADHLVLGSSVTIVGNGNVAVDLVRLLLTRGDDLRQHGVADDVIAAIASGPVTRIDVVGRSDAHAAKFDTAMVRELAKLPDVRFLADDVTAGAVPSDSDADGHAKRTAVEALVDQSPLDAARTVRFHFGWTPQHISGDDAVRSITFARTRGGNGTIELEADAILTAIGFAEVSTAPVQRGHHETEHSDLEIGYLAHGLYCVGWLRRGPQGTIPANRLDSKMVADVIAATFDAGDLLTGKPGLDSLTLEARA